MTIRKKKVINSGCVCWFVSQAVYYRLSFNLSLSSYLQARGLLMVKIAEKMVQVTVQQVNKAVKKVFF
jgi:hypothetical protein